MKTHIYGNRYALEGRIEALCNGGNLAMDRDETVLFASCGDVVNVIDLATAIKRYSLPGVRPRQCHYLPWQQP
jgi:hypothetical protein